MVSNTLTVSTGKHNHTGSVCWTGARLESTLATLFLRAVQYGSITKLPVHYSSTCSVPNLRWTRAMLVLVLKTSSAVLACNYCTVARAVYTGPGLTHPMMCTQANAGKLQVRSTSTSEVKVLQLNVRVTSYYRPRTSPGSDTPTWCARPDDAILALIN